MTDRLSETPPCQASSQTIAALALLLPLVWWFLAPLVLNHPSRQAMLGAAIEMAVVLIGILAFCVAWRCRTGEFSKSLLPLACAMLVCSGAGVVGMTGYFDMLVDGSSAIPGSPNDTSLYARALLAGLLLTTAVFPRFVLDTSRAQYAGLVVTLLACALLYWFAVRGMGDTHARLADGGQIMTEAVAANRGTVAILLLSALLFWQQIRNQGRQDLSGLFLATFALLLGGVCLEAGRQINSVFLLLAQVYKVLACYFVCHAIFIAAFLFPKRQLSELVVAQRREYEAQGQALALRDSLLDGSPVMLWESGADPARNWFNQRWRDFTGASLEQLLGAGWQEYVHPDDAGHCSAIYKEAFAGRQAFSMEYRLRERGGAYLWLLDRGMPRYETDGQFSGFSGGCVEISDKVQIRLQLERSEERLRLALEAVQQGIYDLNVHTGEAWVNTAYASMLGYDPATFQESIAAWTERLHPDDKPGAVEYLQRYLKGELPVYHAEFRQRMSNGDWKWILSIGKLIVRNMDDQSPRMMGSCTDITWRKQSEADAEQLLTQTAVACRAAETSGRLLDSVFSRVNDGFVALDNDWHYTYVNASAARMLQRSSPGDLIGTHIWSEFPESVEQPFQKACLSAHESQQAIYFEQHIQPWDLWFENRIYPSSDGVTIYFAEVTARKRAELAMTQQVERLQQAEAHARLGCWEFDVESGQFWWSAQTYAMLGINPAVEVPRFPDYLSGLHPDDLPVVIAAMGAMESGVAPAPLQFRSAPGIGAMRWFTTTVRQIENLEGKIKFAGTLLDVTAIKSAELAMRASESNLRTLIQTIPDCVSLKDTEGTYLLCNVTMQRALGVREADIVGKTDFDFLSRQEAEEIRRTDRLAVESSQPIINEGWVTFADSARQVLLETIKTPVRSPEGLVVGVLAIARDITALREAQESLTLLNRDLEQRVAERTEQLHALNQSLESFVYSVSHDLKAPLRGVDGYSKLLQEDCSELLGSEGMLFINNIRGGVARMNELIDDLLDYSRIDRRTMERSPIELLPLLEQVIVEQLPDRELREEILNIAIQPISFLADRNGLKLALRNLLDNAIKFSSHNAAPSIEITATEGESSIIMSIRDNGIGFDLKYHDRIFEIFQRLHRIEDYPGTGIGLALVRKAVQRMGGRVWATSEPGAGAAFYIELPKRR